MGTSYMKRFFFLLFLMGAEYVLGDFSLKNTLTI